MYDYNIYLFKVKRVYECIDNHLYDVMQVKYHDSFEIQKSCELFQYF